MNRILVTGATGKVGKTFIHRLLADSRFDSFTVRALCHNRELALHERIENFHGSIEHRDVVEKMMEGVTHVLHLATVIWFQTCCAKRRALQGRGPAGGWALPSVRVRGGTDLWVEGARDEP